jgi:hypothetical protein
MLTRLVRSARDQLSVRTRRTPPAVLRVRVHPTVDAFVRASGQPWWMSGATDGSEIELVPIALLRQRGQLERAIRHEVAHAFVDPPLAGRPQWVREGAAMYFAEPATDQAVATRGTCPSDEELLQPISAGAYRGALARADACFRRAIGRGQAWDQVR